MTRRFIVALATAAAAVSATGTSASAGSQTSSTQSPDPAALLSLSEAYQSKSDNRRSLEAAEQALALYRGQSNADGELRALTAIASAHGRLSDYQKSIEFYTRTLPLLRERGDRRGEAAALSGIGAARVRLNDYAAARAVLGEAVPIYQSLGDRAGEAAALQSIGYASFSQDEYATAIDVYDRALALARSEGSRGLEASIGYNLGQTYYHLGDYQQSLDLYRDALAVHRALANRSGEAAALSAIGRVYRFMGDYQQALDHHGQALVTLRAIGERMNEATSLNNSGHVYLSMGRHADARPFFQQSLEICRAVGNRAGEASNTNGIGLVHAGLKEFEKALPYHRDALQMFRAVGHRRAEADSLGHIGRVYDGLGNYELARAHLNEALAIYRDVNVPRQESETLYTMARTAQKAGDLATALNDIDSAIGLAEGFRRGVSSQQLRTSYQGTIRDFYELKIDVLMQQHRRSAATDARAAAFDASERSRARSLLDLLAEARADIRGDVDASLLDRERRLRQQLAGRAERQTQLAGGNTAPDQLAAIARAIQTDLRDYEQVLQQLRASSPRYAALMQPEPLTLGQIQASVLDGDTVLLEYFLGAERSYVWAVSTNDVTAYELPRRSVIEAAARQFYDRLSTNDQVGQLAESARALSDLVLAPAAARLRYKRLAVVADGALHYVPFAALPDPSASLTGPRDQPIIIDHEIVTLPSASTLAVLRTESSGREAARGLVAVMADPVFDANDVRVRRKAAQQATAARIDHRDGVLRSLQDVSTGQAQWPPPRLLGTRREARAILSLAPEAKRREALDFDASRETAVSGVLDGYQVLHFATHALINNDHPELSGLVLSLVDGEGRSRDGFLRLNDIYNLRLPAELVVLSACRTGLGKEMRGEGLISLTRGFMYAGARRVLTSLWQVDDAGTSELMARFYRSLLADPRLNAAGALRSAQIEMWRERDWHSPYYWAAFTVQGEWRPAR